MSKSLFIKIFSMYVIILLIFSALMVLLIPGIIEESYVNSMVTDLSHLESALKFQVVNYLDTGDYDGLEKYITRLSKDITTRITVIAPDGKVLADSLQDPHKMENHRNRPEVDEALSTGGISKAVRFSSTAKEKMLYVAMPIQKDNSVIAIIRTSLFLKDIHNLLASLKSSMLKIIAVVAILSIIGALIFSRSLIKPVNELALASREVARGNFDARLFLKRQDELKELADSFNYMTAQIQKLFIELSVQKEKLNSIINSIQEALVVVDEKGKIILSNQSFRELVNDNTVDDKLYWELLRELQFDELIKSSIQQNTNLSKEIEYNDRYYLCSTSLLTLQKGVVLILHDITDMKSLEKIKRDLIDNVSHELRTPLTAVKGFIESLSDEIGEKGLKHLNIIKKNTDRLIRIVNDLLVLSHLEKKEPYIDKAPVNLHELIDSISELFQSRIKEKNLTLIVDVPTDFPTVMGDAFRLEQMFINLLDNAVNYTDKGKISITVQRENNSAIISIADTGIGIASEHLPRIFERFYVIDKSRSRKTSGTGLGLAIVRHIVLLHNGNIKVQSSPGLGTTFTITLPM